MTRICRLLLLLATSSLGACAVGTSPENSQRPNVLFIAIDDLNDWIGCLGGHPDAKTPNIDRLAARGTLFTRAYAAAPACNPSRAALLTGIRPSTSGVYQNLQPWRPVMREAVTLPQHFKQNDYHVAGAGKIFHGIFSSPRRLANVYLPYSESWHEYRLKGPNIMPEQYPASGIPNMTFFDWSPLQVADDAMDDHQVATWAIERLKRSHDKPLFLACGIYRPHLPWYVPQKYFDMFPLEQITLPKILENDLDDVPPSGHRMASPGREHRMVTESDNYHRAVQGYLASIAFADAQVGRVVDALDQSAFADNTVIVLWGDHGWHLGEKQHWRKFTLWEEADRVPLLIVAPGVTEPGGRCDRTVSLMDIYPTLADLAGLPISETLEGVSLRPLLQNPDAEWDRPALTTHGRNNHALRSERWRYIRYADGTEELYDHEADPLEWTNLAVDPQYDDVKKELSQWFPEVNAPPAPNGPGRSVPTGSVTSAEREQRRDMTSLDALSQMKILIDSGEIPYPPYALNLDKWELPSDESRTVKIPIDDREYLLYAPAVTRVVAGDNADLSEVLAPTKYKDPGELLLRSIQSQYTAFVMSGLLFLGADLEVVDHPLFWERRERRWKWKRAASSLIKRGGYLAYVGPVGVLLQGEDDSYLIAFDRPSEESPYPLPQQPMDFDRGAAGRINLSVAGKNIHLKSL